MKKTVFEMMLVFLIFLTAFQAGKGDEFFSRSLRDSFKGQTKSQHLYTDGDFLQRCGAMNGASEPAELSDREVDDLNKRLEVLKRQLDRQYEEWRRFLKEKDIKRFEKEFWQVNQKMKELAGMLADMMGKQFLPLLEQEMKRLKERLQEFYRERRSKPEILET